MANSTPRIDALMRVNTLARTISETLRAAAASARHWSCLGDPLGDFGVGQAVSIRGHLVNTLHCS
jgi:hypothetical protein